jgi:hypothetical protein
VSVELRKYRTVDGRVSIEVIHNGGVIVQVDYDVASDQDVRRCVGLIHDAAPAVDGKLIDAELRATDPAALELIDERGMVWRRPDALPDPLPAVTPYPSSLLPRSVGAAVDDIAERMQCPPDFPAAAMLVAMAAVIGCRVGIRPRRSDDWLVVPNLWGCVIGRPSLKKSPAIATAEKRLRAIEARDADRMADAIRDAEIESRIAKAQKKQAEKDLEKAAKDGDRDAMRRLAEEIERLDENVELVARRIVTTDCTIEKLSELLSVHPAGLILWVDELIAWMRGLDREDKAGQRQQFLTLWNGHGKLNIDRIGRGEIVVESACLSLFGCSTPGALSDYVSSAVRGGRGDDGLIQRLQVTVWPDSPREYRQVDIFPDNDAQQALREVFERLADLDPSDWGRVDDDEPAAIPWVRFDANGQRVFDAWDLALQTRIRGGNLPEAFESHLSKFASLMPSVALILHLAMGDRGSVSAEAATMAVRWCEYLESHAGRVYAMATCPERQVAIPLLDRLLEWPKEDPIRVRSIRIQGWSGLSDSESIQAALELLTDAGWIQAIPHRPTGGGRPTVDFVVHPEASKILDTLRGSTIETTETPSKASSDGFDGGGLGGVGIISKGDGRIRGVIE